MTASATPRPAPPLDDVMLAMDVVDTLRERRELVERELDEPERARALVERLRNIYAAQGIDVPDEVLAQGVAALREDRFVYHPAPPSLGTTLARVYVSRRRWGSWTLAGLAVVALGYAGYRAEVVGPRNALPGELADVHRITAQVATGPGAADRVEALYASAQSALQERDLASARSRLADLRALHATLEQSYTVRIVNRRGEASGVWRVPDVNARARNYYLIVEAVGSGGERMPVRVANEETGASDVVRTWGVRVDEATFEAVRRDKEDDGILQHDAIGSKARGALAPTYSIPTTGATITRW